MSWVILMSRGPAIPTFYARDGQRHYASSMEVSAIHYRKMLDAVHVNERNGLSGLVVPCSCAGFVGGKH